MSTLLGMKKLFVVVLQLHGLEFFFVHLPSSLPYSESKYVKIRNVYDYVQIIGMEIFLRCRAILGSITEGKDNFVATFGVKIPKFLCHG